MPVVIPPGFAQITHRFSGISPVGSQPAVVYGVEGQGSLAKIADIHLAFADLWQPLFSDDWALESSIWKQGPVTTGPTFEYAETITGDITGESASPQVAALLAKTTNFGGRMNRGRMYLPGVPIDVMGSDGGLSGGMSSSLATAAETFLDALFNLDAPMVILHSSSSDPTAVNSMIPRGFVATQRRRLRK